MLEINSKNIRFLARMGARGVLGQAVYDYICDGNDVYVVSADLARASGFDRIKKYFPDNLINVGIAEQNMIGVSAGLSSTGTPVIATTWATFSSVRAADQIRNFMGFMKSNIKLIGLESGLAGAEFGYTHSNCPDISFIRSIPDIKILCPCDGAEIYQMIYYALEYQGPVYIRLTGKSTLPVIYRESNYKYVPDKSCIVKKGKDTVIIASGTVVDNAMSASEFLENDNISAEVIDMHTIVPLDIEIIEYCRKFDTVFVLEDHLITGGLYSSISEYICCLKGKNKPRVIPLGISNGYIAAGSQQYAEKICGIDAYSIAKKIKNEVV